MSVVAITGASGFLGAQLTARLANESAVQNIVALDIAPPPRQSPKAVFIGMDVRDPGLVDVLRQHSVTTVVHLAFNVNPLRDKRLLYDIDINGTRNVISASVGAAADKIVFCSSTSVYGLHRDNPAAITETQPMQPNPDNLYAVHKAVAETLFVKCARQHPEIALTILRPCMILGPHMDNFSCRMARALRFMVAAKGCNPELQFVHEDDVAHLFARAITQDLPGTFNLVGTGTLDMQRFCALFRKKVVRMRFSLLHALHSLLWAVRFPGLTFGPNWIDILRYSCVASGEKLARDHAYVPAYSSEAALTSYLQAHAVP